MKGAAHHAIVNRLLDTTSIGVHVTDGFRFNPEQATDFPGRCLCQWG